MDDFYKVRQYDEGTLVVFQTPSLMNPAEVERVRGDLIRLADEQGRPRLVLDFGKVSFLSSQVIGIILTLNTKLTPAAGKKLVLCGVGPKLLELLKISRLDRLLTIKPGRKEALTA